METCHFSWARNLGNWSQCIRQGKGGRAEAREKENISSWFCVVSVFCVVRRKRFSIWKWKCCRLERIVLSIKAADSKSRRLLPFLTLGVSLNLVLAVIEMVGPYAAEVQKYPSLSENASGRPPIDYSYRTTTEFCVTVHCRSTLRASFGQVLNLLQKKLVSCK